MVTGHPRLESVASIAAMRARLNRLAGLLARYRSDRRLPPHVFDLYRQALRLRVASRTSHRTASLRSPLGAGPATPVLLGARQVVPIGPLPMSTHLLGHRFATSVIDVLDDGGLDPFVVGRASPDGLIVGMLQQDRDRALHVLVEQLAGAGWMLTWTDRKRTGTIELEAAGADRSVQRARRWELFQVFSWGSQAIGADSAVELTFWELGTSGEMELIGTRGHPRFDARCPKTVEVIDGVEYPSNTAFPVGADMGYFDQPIDVVYTWVDGADPDWQESFRRASVEACLKVSHGALDPARFRNRDELRYSLRSVWAYLGWVRHIHIVTNGQVPAWLRNDDRVRIVPHDQILPSDALPTFNSHAIEAALHRIPDLAEHFIYFNDDVFVGRPLRPEHFFAPNGLALMFSGEAIVHGVEDESSGGVDTAARRGRELLRERFGRVAIGKPLHAPHPQRRSTMAEVENEFPDVVERTMHSRFRSPTDLSVASSFALHYGVAIGRAVFGRIEAEYVSVESGRLEWHLDRLRLGRRFDTFCVNETADLGGDPVARETLLSDFFEEYFPVPAPWEIDRTVSA